MSIKEYNKSITNNCSFIFRRLHREHKGLVKKGKKGTIKVRATIIFSCIYLKYQYLGFFHENILICCISKWLEHRAKRYQTLFKASNATSSVYHPIGEEQMYSCRVDPMTKQTTPRFCFTRLTDEKLNRLLQRHSIQDAAEDSNTDKT